MQTLWQDVRYALRQLRRSPGFTATAVLTLALGIGATTAIFTLVYQVMLRSIPVEHPEQLYKAGKNLDCCVDGGLENDWTLFSTDLYQYLRDQTAGTDGIAAVQGGTNTQGVHRVGDANNTQPLEVRFISGNYFSVLGTTAYAGRLLGPGDDRAGAAPAAVISFNIWQTKFGGDRGIVGSTLMMTGHPVTVVGITSERFIGDRNNPNPSGIWIPMALEPVLDPGRQLQNAPSQHWLNLLIRSENPERVPAIQAAIQTELRQWIDAHREFYEGATEKDFARQTTEITPASDGINDLRDEYEGSLKLLFFVAAFVLLIACTNLANLMLVRGMGRQQELSVRSALGAPRSRLMRQTLVESMLLAVFGGTLALAAAYAGTHAIIALAMGGGQNSTLSASPSLPVLGFALLISVVTGVLFGIAPAWITSRCNPAEAMRGSNRSTRDASALPQRIMVILQASLSVALLSTAGLLITSLRHLQHQDFHFQPQGRLYLVIDLRAGGYTYDRLAGLYRRFDDTFSHLAGVQEFSYATYAPMSDDNWRTGVFFPGVPFDPEGDFKASYVLASPHYFAAIGTKVLLGRGISERDTAASNHVAVVNQTFAAKYFKSRSPIGEHFGERLQKTGQYEIVGVVEDTKYRHPSERVPAMFFTPITQSNFYTDPNENRNEEFKHFAQNIVVQYRGDQASIAASVRQAIKTVDPEIPVLRMNSYQEQVSRSFTQEELVVRLTSLFGLLALVLASIGLYGVTAYAVARRTSEIGIRMALGASRGSVLQMVVRNALAQALTGLAIGLPLAYAGGRLVQSSLYQTSALQPVVLIAAIAMLIAASVAAAMIPARRAASIVPMQALRTE